MSVTFSEAVSAVLRAGVVVPYLVIVSLLLYLVSKVWEALYRVYLSDPTPENLTHLATVTIGFMSALLTLGIVVASFLSVTATSAISKSQERLEKLQHLLAERDQPIFEILSKPHAVNNAGERNAREKVRWMITFAIVNKGTRGAVLHRVSALFDRDWRSISLAPIEETFVANPLVPSGEIVEVTCFVWCPHDSPPPTMLRVEPAWGKGDSNQIIVSI